MLLLFVSFLVTIVSVHAAPVDQEITTLPNLTEPLRSKHYAGYLPISATKQLFYWYIESEDSPATAPLVLWLNGGPGCASMEGLFIEMGPFRVRNNGEQVVRNPWTWNRIANIIYLDAPAGVGFSYYNTTDKKFTDDEVAQDNYEALQMWFDSFPEYKTNDLYIAGESYGGTYVPMLSAKITHSNDTFPQFKGMLVGNGCVDDQINFNTNIMYQYYHAVMDESNVQNVVQQCCNGTMDCDYYTISQQTSNCSDLVNDLSYSIYYTGYDPYFLYFACYLNPNLPYPPHEEMVKPQKEILRNHLMKKITSRQFTPPSNDIQGQPVCASHSDHFPYLNSAEVRKALRIPDYIPKYEMCNNEIAKNYISLYPTMKAFFNTVINAKKHVAMFNGDADTLCNYVENSQFIYKTLQRPLKTPMTYWNDPVQLPMAVGQVTEYDGITLISIKGGGHFPAATEQKPKETFQMFQNYVKNQNYSTPVTFDKEYGSTTVATGTTGTPGTTASNTPVTVTTSSPQTTASVPPVTATTGSPQPTTSDAPVSVTTSGPPPTTSDIPGTVTTNTPKTTASNTPVTVTTSSPQTTASVPPVTATTGSPQPTTSDAPVSVTTSGPPPTTSDIPGTVTTNTPKTTASNTPVTVTTSSPQTTTSDASGLQYLFVLIFSLILRVL
ncbi:hypothetical protein L5515_002980 [Caenorhabditis briggsae]|uniref:Carboxypeptidase n=1 Tax=Caenorhabditis briggsae TaxID=6238 RepID=A0AAE9EFU6_CAEBR|nr:hypothetical protein L5515_002980 [Caenorhabditis briggsae]